MQLCPGVEPWPPHYVEERTEWLEQKQSGSHRNQCIDKLPILQRQYRPPSPRRRQRTVMVMLDSTVVPADGAARLIPINAMVFRNRRAPDRRRWQPSPHDAARRNRIDCWPQPLNRGVHRHVIRTWNILLARMTRPDVVGINVGRRGCRETMLAATWRHLFSFRVRGTAAGVGSAFGKHFGIRATTCSRPH